MAQSWPSHGLIAASVNPSMTLDKDLQSIQEARRLVEKADEAQKVLARLSQQKIDAIVAACAEAARQNVENLARLAVEDEQLDFGYSIALPNAGADAALQGEKHNTTFVNYLRLAFRWGGFPGWEQEARRPERELKFLTEGLLPI